MKKIIVLLIAIGSMLTSNAQQVEFTEEALQDLFIDLNGNEVTFASVIEKHKGKTIVIDVWASWCKDCIKGMPKVIDLQANNNDVQFVFLSLDKSLAKWKKGVKKLKIKEIDHYYIKAGWKGSAFCTSINLDWIPRYMIVDEEGKIALFKAIEADDNKLINTLKTLQ